MIRTTIWRAPLLALAAAMLVAGAAQAKPDARKGEQISAQCQACHGSNGVSVSEEIPNLAGQHYQYLLEQMMAYKHRTRINELMNEMIGPLSVEQIEDIAAYYSRVRVSAAAR